MFLSFLIACIKVGTETFKPVTWLYKVTGVTLSRKSMWAELKYFSSQLVLVTTLDEIANQQADSGIIRQQLFVSSGNKFL
jgi:hypothetical protein